MAVVVPNFLTTWADQGSLKERARDPCGLRQVPAGVKRCCFDMVVWDIGCILHLTRFYAYG